MLSVLTAHKWDDPYNHPCSSTGLRLGCPLLFGVLAAVATTSRANAMGSAGIGPAVVKVHREGLRGGEERVDRMLLQRDSFGDRNATQKRRRLPPPLLFAGGAASDLAASRVDDGDRWVPGSLSLLTGRMLLHVVPEHRVRQLNRVAVDVRYHGLLEQVTSFPLRRPWTFNVLVATVKSFTGDFLVQVTRTPAGSNVRIDWRRSVFFALFGCLYVGIVQWFFYVSLFGWLCPEAAAFSNKPMASKLADRLGQKDLVIQVLVDQLVINPFIYFPTFYTVKEICFGPKRPFESVVDALKSYRGNFMNDNCVSMVVWFPSDFVIFTAPMYMRMPLDHAIAFLWTMVMSYMHGGAHETAAKGLRCDTQALESH